MKSSLVRVQADFPSPAPPGCFGRHFPFGHKCLGIARCGQNSATTGRNNAGPMAERQFLPATHQSHGRVNNKKSTQETTKEGILTGGLTVVCLFIFKATQLHLLLGE